MYLSEKVNAIRVLGILRCASPNSPKGGGPCDWRDGEKERIKRGYNDRIVLPMFYPCFCKYLLIKYLQVL